MSTDDQPGDGSRTADDVRDLARQAFRTAGQVQLLTERMTALDYRVDGYTPAQMGEFAAALRGMAIRAAMGIDDTDLLSELTGRRAQRLDLGDLGSED